MIKIILNIFFINLALSHEHFIIEVDFLIEVDLIKF